MGLLVKMQHMKIYECLIPLDFPEIPETTSNLFHDNHPPMPERVISKGRNLSGRWMYYHGKGLVVSGLFQVKVSGINIQIFIKDLRFLK